MSIRLKRLFADFTRITKIFQNSPYIRIEKTEGTPPERYEIEYRIRGLEQRGTNVLMKSSHRVEIVLPYGYPREAPKCRMLSPVFHPNIAPHTICIADHWSAGESLPGLIIRIGEMIAYQSYNIKSPLNGEAAKWADENMNRLPIDSGDFEPSLRPQDIVVNPEDMAILLEEKNKVTQAPKAHQAYTPPQQQPPQQPTIQPSQVPPKAVPPPVPPTVQPQNKPIQTTPPKQSTPQPTSQPTSQSTLQPTPPPTSRPASQQVPPPTPPVTQQQPQKTLVCANCRSTGPVQKFRKCSKGHIVCTDCITPCQNCGRSLCVLCVTSRCNICGKLLCRNCRSNCISCGKMVCSSHMEKCSTCGVEICSSCLHVCPICKQVYCDSHFDKSANRCKNCGPSPEDLQSQVITSREVLIDFPLESPPIQPPPIPGSSIQSPPPIPKTPPPIPQNPPPMQQPKPASAVFTPPPPPPPPVQPPSNPVPSRKLEQTNTANKITFCSKCGRKTDLSISLFCPTCGNMLERG